MKNDQTVIEREDEHAVEVNRQPKPQGFERDNAKGAEKSMPAADHPQDTQPVNGETAMNLPRESELVQRSKIQG